jgi:energy-coupling factor transport system ATP-binding protein
MLEFKSVDFSYPGSSCLVLQDVNISISEGEFIAVVGENGCGKSTLAKLAAGLLRPTKGEVLVDNFSFNSNRSAKQLTTTVGIVFENPENQIVTDNVFDEVAFGLENLGFAAKEIKNRVKEVLAAVGLEGKLYANPLFLSSGQKQKLALAASLALDPKYLVLDEPTSMLDARSAKQMISLFTKLWREQGRSIILITHRLAEIAKAGRVIVFSGSGGVVADLSPEEFFSDEEFLLNLGFNQPLIPKLANILNQYELDILSSTLTIDHLMEQLCQLSLRK